MSTPDLATILSIFDPATLLQRGHVAVALSPSRAPKPHKIYYELHGPPNPSAPRVVLIMGLNNSCFAWTNQVNWLVGRGFQVLVFDNRGVGHSDTPEGKLWKTSEMALDALELLDYLGWKEEVGLMGVSMGGMIALELAQLAPPGRFSSLGLISTRAGNRNDLPSYKATYMFLRLLTGTVWSAQQAIALIVDTLFPASYLDVKDLTTDPIVSKRKSVEAEFMVRYNIGRRQSLAGRVGQMAAVFTHHVSLAQLGLIATSIPKIAIITGDLDELVDPRCSKDLHEQLPGSEYTVVEGAGHALPSQIAVELNEWIERIAEEGLELGRALPSSS